MCPIVRILLLTLTLANKLQHLGLYRSPSCFVFEFFTFFIVWSLLFNFTLSNFIFIVYILIYISIYIPLNFWYVIKYFHLNLKIYFTKYNLNLLSKIEKTRPQLTLVKQNSIPCFFIFLHLKFCQVAVSWVLRKESENN